MSDQTATAPGQDPVDRASIRERRRHLLILCALVFLSRVIPAAVVAASGTTWTGPNSRDFWTSTDGYVALAQNLVETGRFAFSPDVPPSVHRGPAFPAAIALAYYLTRSYEAAVLLVNALAAAATVAIVYVLAHRWYGPRASFWIALLALLHPVLIYYALSSWSDTLVTAAFVIYVWATLCAFEKPQASRMVASGVALALLLMAKSVFVPVPVFALLASLVFRRRWVRPLTVQLAVAAIALTPWTIRNYAIVHRPTLVSLGAGFNLLTGNFMVDHAGGCDAAFAAAVDDTFSHIEAERGLSLSSDDVRSVGYYDIQAPLDRVFFVLAVEQIKREPGRLVRKVLVNAGRFWYFASTPPRCLAILLLNLPVLFLAALELLQRRRSNSDAIVWIVGAIACVWLTYSLIIVHSRFYLPLLPLLLPFALARVGALLSWATTERTAHSTT